MMYSRRFMRNVLFGAGTLGLAATATSLHTNQYNVDSIGIVRFGRASFAALTVVFYYKTKLYGQGKKLDKNSKEYNDLRSEVHKKAAETLLSLCRSNKGVYIKVGQHIGALDYILPTEYVDTMKVLHSQAPASSIEEVYQVLKEDLHQDPHEVFESFDPKPLGAASLAQVHKVKLKDGRTIALKVQHPTVKSNSSVDLKTMEILAKIVSLILPDFKVQWLVNETKRNIPKELDFEVEADNTEKAKVMFHHMPWLKIPTVYRDMCSSRVLAMEYIEGGQVNDLDYIKKNKINPYEVSDKLGQLYSEMIFKRGFVHSDPHPGNILVKKSEKGTTEIVLLDHGLYATLTDDFRFEYAQLWISILNKDMESMSHHCAALGVPDLFWLFASMVTGRSWDAIRSGLNTTRFDNSEKELVQKEFPNLLAYITDVLSNVNRQMILILKTNDLLRGIEHSLETYSRMGSFSIITKNCIETIYSEKRKNCHSKFGKLKFRCAEHWALLKLNIYYNYLRLLQTNLKTMCDLLEVNEHHQSVIAGYTQLHRYQRQQYLKSVESSINDTIDSRLVEDTFTRDEVIEILTKIRNSISDDLEAELINFVQSNILMLYQLFRQAEKWHLQLNVDLSEIQNKEMLKAVNNLQNLPVNADKPKLTPLSTNIEKTSEILRMEIVSLTAENEQLRKDVSGLQEKILNVRKENEMISIQSEEKDKLIEELQEGLKNMKNIENVSTIANEEKENAEKILEDYDSVLREQIARELEEMKQKVDAAQSQLTLAEMELEKKFNNTAAYNNMKKIINKKNEQIKDLRTRLQKYENLDEANIENTQ